MSSHTANINHLALLVRRMLDAELLLEEEGAALLSETEAVRRSLEAGDPEAARRHIERFALFTEALVERKTLPPADGYAVIQVTHILLNPPDADDPPC